LKTSIVVGETDAREATMPIEILWLQPDKILLSQWTGVISVEDTQILVEELLVILNAARNPVHTIIDLTATKEVLIDALRVYFNSPAPRHPNRGRLALLRSDEFESEDMNQLIDLLLPLGLFRVFSDRYAARDYLLEFDDSALPPTVDMEQWLSNYGQSDSARSSQGSE
jgi:hypothetical protein